MALISLIFSRKPYHRNYGAITIMVRSYNVPKIYPKAYKRWTALEEATVTAYKHLAEQWASQGPDCDAIAYLQFSRLIQKAPSTTRKKINQFLVKGEFGWVPTRWQTAGNLVRDIPDFDDARKAYSEALGIQCPKEELIWFGHLREEDYPDPIGIWVYLPGCLTLGPMLPHVTRCTARWWVQLQIGPIEQYMSWEAREADMDRHPKFPFQEGLLIRNQFGKYYAYEFTWEAWDKLKDQRGRPCKRC